MKLLPEELEEVRIALNARIWHLKVMQCTSKEESEIQIYLARDLAWTKLALKKICQ